MNKAAFLLLTQFILFVLQLLLGNGGLPVPLALPGALYMVLAFGKNWGMAAALLTGTVTAALYGGSWNLLCIALYPLLAWLLNFWIERHDEAVRIDFWLPGMWCGLFAALPSWCSLLCNWVQSGNYPPLTHWLLLRTLWSMAVSAGLFIVITFIGEALTEFLGLPRFLTRKSGIER